MHFSGTTVDADVLVIGGGLAGTWAALRAKDIDRYPLKPPKFEKHPYPVPFFFKE